MRGLIEGKPHVQVGEVGLDFSREDFSKQKQMQVFETQLDMALSKLIIKPEYDRICSVHCVRAHGEMLKIIKRKAKEMKAKVEQADAGGRRRIIMHSFGGSKEIAQSLTKIDNIDVFLSYSNVRSDVE